MAMRQYAPQLRFAECGLPVGSMDWLDALQWPAMVVTLLGAWLVASRSAPARAWGFWVYLASNVLWIVWGWHSGGWALVVLQIGLVALNIRGALKNEG
jgi:hypothetical protein